MLCGLYSSFKLVDPLETGTFFMMKRVMLLVLQRSIQQEYPLTGKFQLLAEFTNGDDTNILPKQNNLNR